MYVHIKCPMGKKVMRHSGRTKHRPASIKQILSLMMQLCTKYTSDNVIFIPYFNNKIHENIISHRISREETSFCNGHDLKSAQSTITPWE